MSSGLSELRENNGVAVADYNGDLDLDLFVVAKTQDEVGIEKTFSKLFRNNNDGSFTDVTIESNLTNLFPIEEFADTYLGLDGIKIGTFENVSLSSNIAIRYKLLKLYNAPV